MSRLARNPINIPEDIKVSLANNVISFEGKLGKSTSTLPEGVAVDLKDNFLHFTGENKAMLGTVYANVKNEIIENVAEKILTQEKSVGVIDENNQIVGTVHPSKIINTVFGGKKMIN